MVQREYQNDMVIIRRTRHLGKILFIVFIFSAAYLTFLLFNINSNNIDEYDDNYIFDPFVIDATTERDFIDPDVHVFVDESEEPDTKNKMISKANTNYINIYNGSQMVNKSSCVPFKTWNGDTPICVYSKADDNMISAYVTDYGTWEPELLNITGEIILTNHRLKFVDLGCNIGTFTLFVAKLGRNVIALDALSYNLDLLQESLRLGKIQEKVVLILNALSDDHREVSVNVVRGNVGGSYIKESRTAETNNPESSEQPLKDTTVKTVIFDDLLDLVPSGSEVFIKMDIEGNELKALKHASNFFQSVNVRFLLMEWMLHRTSKSGRDIVNFLLRNGMLPYNPENTKDILPRNYGSWPDNVLWIKR